MRRNLRAQAGPWCLVTTPQSSERRRGLAWPQRRQEQTSAATVNETVDSRKSVKRGNGSKGKNDFFYVNDVAPTGSKPSRLVVALHADHSFTKMLRSWYAS